MALRAVASGKITDFAFRVACGLITFINRDSGRAWPSIATLAERVGAAVSDGDSRGVRKALCALQDAGLIKRKWRGRGRSNDYYLRVPPHETDARNRHAVAGDGTVVDASARYGGASGPGMAVPGNLMNEPILNSLSSRENSRDCTNGNGARLSEGFDAFMEAYPFHDTMNRLAARREFEKLREADRRLAIDRARAYKATCREQRRKLPTHAVNWLRDREFQSSTVYPAAASTIADGRTFVADSSPLWPVMVERFRRERAGAQPPNSMQVGREHGWRFPDQWLADAACSSDERADTQEGDRGLKPSVQSLTA